MPIHNSKIMTWDNKVGNLTQASIRGVWMEDVIPLPEAKMTANDIVFLNTYKSSSVIKEIVVTKRNPGTVGGSIKFKFCLLGIDPTTKAPFIFTYHDDDGTGNKPICDNFMAQIGNGDDNSKKCTVPFELVENAENAAGLQCICRGGFSRSNTVPTSSGTTNANALTVFRMVTDDMNLGQIANMAMTNQVKLDGNPADNEAQSKAKNYDPSHRKGYSQFGIGMYFSEEVALDKMQKAGLKVTVVYKDTMLSETSYGLNYIPATVSY
jgi:hypothetical protein